MSTPEQLSLVVLIVLAPHLSHRFAGVLAAIAMVLAVVNLVVA